MEPTCLVEHLIPSKFTLRRRYVEGERGVGYHLSGVLIGQRVEGLRSGMHLAFSSKSSSKVNSMYQHSPGTKMWTVMLYIAPWRFNMAQTAALRRLVRKARAAGRGGGPGLCNAQVDLDRDSATSLPCAPDPAVKGGFVVQVVRAKYGKPVIVTVSGILDHDSNLITCH
jgi:hypothetical protein